MKFLIAITLAIAYANADVSDLAQNTPIIKSTYDHLDNGAYQYAYETADGIYADASGVIENANSDNPSLKVTGSFKYAAPDGQVISVQYTADENGFHPTSDSIPVAPEIPEYISRSLEWVAAHPPAI